MIRRISKKNDLRDIIKSCPTGVIDDITSIKYYIQGYNTYIDVDFEKVGQQLVAILPTSLLETLPNGILMRKASYRVVDTSYPDGYYNLEFDDNMNIWLGENDSEEPVIPEYVTEDELSSTLSSYATISLLSSSLEPYALSSYVQQGDSNVMSWVLAKNYITSEALFGYATESWVSNQGYLTSVPDYFATQSWVSSQGYITSQTIPSDIATQSWVESQGYITSESIPSGIATQSWVSSNFLSTTALNGYATESWVSSNFLSTTALSGYATQSWVQSQGYLSSVPNTYAKQSWVSSNFLSTTALNGYATQSWVSSNFLDSSAIWTGSLSEWVLLSPEEQATYIIALVTE